MPSTQAFSVAGKVALITGASSGFGRHFAKVLAREGAKVGIAARRVDALQSLAQEIRGGGGVAAVAQLDVADVASISPAVEAIERELGRIDVLVNNSGTSVVKPVLDYTEQDWDTVADVNLKGAFFVATEVARRMRADGRGGSIINIESILSFRQSGHIPAYVASKAGLTQLTKTMALELGALPHSRQRH
jgi:NAD(P)-dependent dehydrogenase (short-subunit alcohol dehydrogenase family)